MRISTAVAFLLTFFGEQSFAQTAELRQKIEQILRSKEAAVGVAVAALESGDTLTVNGGLHYPMQSVFKFHLALKVLSLVDKGELSLDQKIHISKSDLLPGPWSPLKKKYPEGNVDLPLGELLRYTVSLSDNSGCDILFRLTGGPEITHQYIHSLGITGLSIAATEEEMQKNSDTQYMNWSTPIAAVELLRKFYKTKMLSKSSRDLLWQLMVESPLSKDKIKGLLPPGTIVAHRSGLSLRDEHGITAASNDIGIIRLPNGRHFAIAVFVSESKEDEATNEKIISEIAKAAWDYFYKQTPP